MKILTISVSNKTSRRTCTWSDSTVRDNVRAGVFTYPLTEDDNIITRFKEEGYKITLVADILN